MFDPSDYDPEDWGLIGKKGADKPVVLVAEGIVTANPLPGENRAGKRNCTFTMSVTGGIDMNFYTVRYRDECMKLVSGDKIRVRYVRNDNHNNLVASPEMLEEGGKLDRVMSAIESLDKCQNSIMKQISHLSMDLLEIRKKLDEIQEVVNELNEPYDDEEDGYEGEEGNDQP